MDLNDLYHRHGTSLLMAARAACEPSRTAHRGMAAGYARRIGDAVRGDRGTFAIEQGQAR